MNSIRRRLTVWYAIALVASLAAFGAALYFERRRSSVVELDERLALEGNLAAQYWLNTPQQVGHILAPGESPILSNAPGGGYLEAIRDYVVVFDPDGFPIYRNAAARTLSPLTLTGALAALSQAPSSDKQAGVLRIGADSLAIRYAQSPLVGVWQRPAAIFVAAPLDAVPFGPQQLLNAMLVIGPLIVIVSIGLGYVLADASLRPLGGMVDELEAITDGRSLHRRLAVPLSAEELARLSTTMNRMLARLEESFASLRRFTADASHELKTPLMVIRAGVERALTHEGTPPEAMSELDEVLEEINRVTEMVDNLLTLARADEGRATLATQPCDLRELLNEAAETAGILAERPGITVRTEVPTLPVELAVDRSRMRQLLLNLVTNAIKYTLPGGKVSLGLVDQGEAVALVVGDDGIGIAAVDLPHIFDRFYRVDHARSRTGDRPGAGLGLAITKWIAEAHGGSITVQSRSGRGTVFTVTLPREAGRLGRGAAGPMEGWVDRQGDNAVAGRDTDAAG